MPSRSVGQVEFSAAAVSVAALGLTTVPWTYNQGDAAAVSLAVPTAPAPVAAGVYAYSLRIDQIGGGAGNAYTAVLQVDNDFYGVGVVTESDGLSAVLPQATVSLAATWFGDAGSPFVVQISNAGPVGTDTFNASIFVQQIS